MKQNKLSYKVGQFLMFAGPATILFAAVVIVPFFYGLYLTFTSWDGVAANKPFVGLQNYKDAFADTAYWDALGLKGQNFFRAGFFIPNLIGGIVLGYVWKFMFNRAFVAIGTAVVGHDTSSLLGTTNGALFALILVSVWQYAGYMMLIYVAGFMGVDDSLREAALIDGCSNGQAMRHVIIPLMRASFVQCIFLSTTRCFMVYDLNLSLTKGEPFNSSVMAAMHVYNKAFVYKNYGVGQAEALILFIICAVIGMIQVYVGKKGEVAA